MFIHTDVSPAPWFVVDSTDKRRARINTISHLLSTIPTYIEPPAWTSPSARRPRVTSAHPGHPDLRAGSLARRRTGRRSGERTARTADSRGFREIVARG